MKVSSFAVIGAVIGGCVGTVGPMIVAATMENAGQTPILIPFTGPGCAIVGAILGAIVGAIVVAFRKPAAR